MKFGLEEIQLSDDVLAYWAEKKQKGSSGLLDWLINLIVGILDNIFDFSGNSIELFSKSGKEPYYDFYLSRDLFPIDKLGSNVDTTLYKRDYKGIEFNKEIAATLKTNTDPKAKIDGITLAEPPQSAFAYCYNKNKRDVNGVVTNQKWFLPAIDEIEEIALSSYDEFNQVFQNKKYWSCQPAYERNIVRINPHYWMRSWSGYEYQDYSDRIWLEGEFFNDNNTRARATSVYTNGSDYANIESGLPSSLSSGKLTVDSYTSDNNEGENDRIETTWNKSEIDYSLSIFANPNGNYRGNAPRTEKCRVRAVYRSGEGSRK